MTRKEITKFLTDLLISDRLSDRKYYAREVTLGYGTMEAKRIDIMQFCPLGVTYTSDIEKGYFVCYEVKSCIQDVYSGNGLNFYGEKNYIVTTIDTYKSLLDDIQTGKLQKHVCDFMGIKKCPYFGIMVPVPKKLNVRDADAMHSEFENPTKLGSGNGWKIWTAYPQKRGNPRTRSMNELLFCMLRSKHNTTNSSTILSP